MLELIKANLGTIFAALIVGLVIAAIIVSMIIKKKQGKSIVCSGSCQGCQACPHGDAGTGNGER